MIRNVNNKKSFLTDKNSIEFMSSNGNTSFFLDKVMQCSLINAFKTSRTSYAIWLVFCLSYC